MTRGASGPPRYSTRASGLASVRRDRGAGQLRARRSAPRCPPGEPARTAANTLAYYADGEAAGGGSFSPGGLCDSNSSRTDGQPVGDAGPRCRPMATARGGPPAGTGGCRSGECHWPVGRRASGPGPPPVTFFEPRPRLFPNTAYHRRRTRGPAVEQALHRPKPDRPALCPQARTQPEPSTATRMRRRSARATPGFRCRNVLAVQAAAA